MNNEETDKIIDEKINKLTERIGEDNSEIISRFLGYDRLLLSIHDEKLKNVLKTNFVLLIYSCFEGFIKNTTEDFFKFLKDIETCGIKNNLNIRLIEKYHFPILFHECYNKNNEHECKKYIEKFSNSIFTIYDAQQIIFNIKELKINTKSNLKYNIFISILYLLNIDVPEKNFNLNGNNEEIEKILNDLVETRNAIGHGDISYIRNIKFVVDDNRLEIYKELVKYLINDFRDKLTNIIINKEFLSKK